MLFSEIICNFAAQKNNKYLLYEDEETHFPVHHTL